MEHKHAIVVDKNGYKTEFVLVQRDPETGTDTVLYYEMQQGEQLVFEDVPAALAMLKPCWKSGAWVETATAEELDAARPPEQESLPPDPRDLAIAELSMMMAETQLAMADITMLMGGGVTDAN